MRKKNVLVFLIILSLAFTSIAPRVSGGVDEWNIEYCDEDVFYAANPFEGVDIVYLQGDGMQIRSWFWFEGPVIDARRHIREAYLSFRTPSIGATDSDASVVIYGIDADGADSFAENPTQILGPYTTAYTIANLSTVIGVNTWHNITVTNIVREINQRHRFWDGHDIAFVGVSGAWHDEERYVSSVESGYPARLYVHYGDPDPGDPDYPAGLPPDAEYVEDYRNHTIWKLDHFYNASWALYWEDVNNPNNVYYGDLDDLEADGTDHVFVIDNTNAIEYSCKNTITRVNDTIVIMEDPNQIEMYVSTDAGATWTNHILNDQYTDLAAHASSASGSMFTDENGTTHMIWRSYTATSPAAYVGVYSNFTLHANGTINYWDGFTEFTDSMGWNNIEVDQHGRVHIVYDESDVLTYVWRNSTGDWQAPEVIRNTGNAILECSLDVAVHANATRPPIVRFVYQHQWVGVEQVDQSIRESDGTLTHTAMSSNNAFRANSGMWFGGNKSIAVYHDNFGGGSAEIEFRIYDFNTMTLGAAQYVTPTTQAHHFNPDIAIDEGTDTAVFVWQNTFADDGTWVRRYDLNASAFLDVRHSLIAPMDVQTVHIAPTATGGLNYTFWWIVDPNGTIIDTTTTTTDNSTEAVEEVEEYIDEDVIGYPDPDNPTPGDWATTGLITRYNYKLWVFFLGMVLLCGTPMYSIYTRQDGAGWVLTLFLQLAGVVLLWYLQSV